MASLAKEFTPTDIKFVATYFTHMKTKPEVDWDSVARDLGLKDARSASTRFRQIFAKHNWGGQGQDSSAPATPRKKEGKVTKTRTPKKVKKEKDKEPMSPTKEEDGRDAQEDQVMFETKGVKVKGEM